MNQTSCLLAFMARMQKALEIKLNRARLVAIRDEVNALKHEPSGRPAIKRPKDACELDNALRAVAELLAIWEHEMIARVLEERTARTSGRR